jgi:endo-1,4-beta-xylanase
MNYGFTSMLCAVALGTGLAAADTPPEQDPSLAAAMDGFFTVGTAIPRSLENPAERRLLFHHFRSLTPESCMKPQPIQPQEGRFDFAVADALVDMAQAGGLTVHGHTLVWHMQSPDWFFMDGDQPAGRELVRQRLRTHIATTAGHYAGRVKSWDVVNEALDDGGGYLRKTKWLAALGEGYIAEAFFAAREADPRAELYYNDYGIERRPKRDKALRLIRELRARRAPIDGIGIQGHWQIDRIPFNDIEEAIVAFHAEGLKVAITELDVDMVPRATAGAEAGHTEQGRDNPYADGLPPEVQQRLADQYARLFALFLRHHDKLERVSFWGLHDGRTWLNNWPRKRTNHPLLWDRALRPKPAFFTVLDEARTARAARDAKPPSAPPARQPGP